MNIRGLSMGCALLGGVVLTAGQADAAGELIINEYNAVGEAKFHQYDVLKPWDGQDSYFGRIQGNGGNGIGLVVADDHLDIRGWTLEWMNADPDSGVVTFSNDARWSDLRSGTIITIIESIDDLALFGGRPIAVAATERGDYLLVLDLSYIENPVLLACHKIGDRPEGLILVPNNEDLIAVSGDEGGYGPGTVSFVRLRAKP